MTARGRRVEIVQLLPIAAAIVAWFGWFEIAPALGFPTIGPAAMLNRLFVPESDPDAWVGWAVLLIGLVALASLYSETAARGRFRPGVLTGSLFGLVVWAIAGAALMVIIGRISPPPLAPPPPPGPPLPTTPDPMHATFMMLHVGALAPVSALIAWLLFGAVVGAAASAEEPETGRERRRARPAVAAMSVAVAAVALTGWSLASSGQGATAQTAIGVYVEILAEGPAPALPEGPTFVSVIELRQAAGATLGPHAHVPGFAYVLSGRETIAFPERSAMELDPGEGGFMGGLEIHAHVNRTGRAAAGALALGLVALGGALVVGFVRMAARAIIVGLSVLLILAGTVAMSDPWANGWYFIGVRPEASRGGVMPLPDSSRTFESPVLEDVPPGPYTEKLRLITVPSGDAFRVESAPGPEMFLVLNGQADVRFAGGSPISLGASQATLVQAGGSIEISNSSGEALSVLSFRVAAAEPSP